MKDPDDNNGILTIKTIKIMDIYYVNEILKRHALVTDIINSRTIMVSNSYCERSGAILLKYNESDGLWDVDNGSEISKMTLSEYLGY